MARVSIDISTQDATDLVITAVEGGFTVNWAEIRSYNPTRGTVMVREHGDARWRKVGSTTIVRGLQRAAKAKSDEGGWAFGAWLKDRIGDAIIADVILQFGVFGEVKYG